MPVSRGVLARAATTEFKDGWLVRPLMLLKAASAISTPAMVAIRMAATPLPAVSCVCRRTGIFTSSFRVLISLNAAAGFNRADISLMARMCAPVASIS